MIATTTTNQTPSSMSNPPQSDRGVGSIINYKVTPKINTLQEANRSLGLWVTDEYIDVSELGFRTNSLRPPKKNSRFENHPYV